MVKTISTQKSSTRGRKSTLTKTLTLEIRSLLLAGHGPKEIQEKLGINPSTWQGWYFENFQGFRDLLLNTKREILLAKAEDLSRQILSLEHKTKGSKGSVTDINVLRLKQKESEFVRETLGKSQGYSKRQELTGRDGEPLTIRSIVFHPPVMPQKVHTNPLPPVPIPNTEKDGMNDFKIAVKKEIDRLMTQSG